ncbi:MAG: CRISPR system Cascade subunit CasC [Desulfobacteraceae bacterium Eth-SRB1]|nr:MAG: CRISPR system Cascade subunit CasC [Desulfobacteraceae bacterium Eth-SRB1]
MFIELHILQNFAPSNLNRDDTNAPKDCVFGGFRRARISSQCIKRSIRTHDVFKNTIKEAGGDLGIRIKRFIKALSDKLKDRGKDEAVSIIAAENILKCLGIGKTEEQKSEYLLYIGSDELDHFVKLITENGNWDLMSQPPNVKLEHEGGNKKGKKKTQKELKKDYKASFPDKLQKEFAKVISQNKKNARSYAADIALFGRMLADNKNMNVDAACQVAHAISTNEVEMKMDFYTAVDDLLPDEESGSDMMGIVEFNSSCYYRYALINYDLLKKNLGNDTQMADAAVTGFIKAAVQSVPTGMQNSTAPQNPPSYVHALVRTEGAPWSMANAFIHPVRPGRNEGEDLITRSVNELEKYFSALKDNYSDKGIKSDPISTVFLPNRKDKRFVDLIQETQTALKNGSQ